MQLYRIVTNFVLTPAFPKLLQQLQHPLDHLRSAENQI